MKHNFDEVIDRRNSDGKKWSKESFSEDILPMWIADTDFAIPKPIIDALEERVKHPCFGYPVERDGFEKSVVRWEKVRYNWDIEPEWVKYVNGVLPGMMFAIRALSNPGDKVVIQTPVYPPFSAIIKNNDREIVRNSLVFDGEKYQIDFDDLENCLKDEKTKLMLLCNPHNPVTRCYTREELERIGQLCLKYNVVVVSDEIHCDLVYSGHKHIPFGTLSKEIEQNSIVLVNPSKLFNIAGFRVGAMVIPNPEIRNLIQEQIVVNKAYGRTIFGMLVLEKAYTECDYYADQMVEYLEENVKFMLDFFETRIPKIKVIKPEATYLIWLDCRELGMTQEELKDFMLNKAKLALNDGETFGDEGIGFMRINIGCPKTTLEDALNRLEVAINNL